MRPYGAISTAVGKKELGAITMKFEGVKRIRNDGMIKNGPICVSRLQAPAGPWNELEYGCIVQPVEGASPLGIAMVVGNHR